MADLDGDGDLDLLASAIASTHNLTVFFQVSPGSFSAAPLALGDPGTTRPGSIVVADLDVDGDQDLAFGHQQGLGGENGVKAFLQVSPGTFADIPLILGSDGTELFPRSVAAADLDGDGDQDLLAADAFDGVKAFPQSSPGNFGGTPLEFGTGSGFTSVTAADLDGDGDQDLVSASFQQSELTLFFQDSPGPQTDALLTIGSVPATLEAIAVVAADLDGDGLHDLASAHHAISHLTVSFQSSVGAFQDAPLMLGDIDTTRFPVSVAAADLDGDGDLDLASANVNEPVVNLHGWTLFFQDSPGAFVDAPLTLGRPGTTDSPTWIALADLDGDGDADVVSANADSNDLTIFHQLDQGTFASAPVTVGGIPATNRPIFVAVADVDGDGALDLVATNQGRDVTIFFQLAGGTFAAEPLTLGGLPTTNFPNSAVVADLDGDGDQDIASANGVSNNLTIFFHWTPGSFASSPFNLGGLPTTNGPVSLSAGDLDADGDQDLVSANHLGNDLTVFFQLSPGTFATTPLVLGGSGTTDRPSSVTIADLDGDGDPEVVSANYTGNNLTVFFGGR
jgi:hypothetical protein